ncbi:hypothetical protein HII36_46590 [Nonomuraea sp. NN258]|uniref:hypothetical protein n=1 Tax=Nonomuraea antri TaxID=2730852 RepID=UPI0015683D17|nr:hypothetical protein [Nonomuraea antri]NRQ39241.1 hypothetical protein [Nonomuraea antri]
MAVTRAPWLMAARRWLTHGGRWRYERGACRDCGRPVSPGLMYPQPRPVARRRAPVLVVAGVVNVLLRRRRFSPSPVTYLVPALVATLAGIAAQVLWGLPWWPFPLVTVAGLWLVLLAGAVRSPLAFRSLRDELLDVIVQDDERRRRRHRVEMDRALRAAPFPLYGLPASWPGPRHLGGWSQGRSLGAPGTAEYQLGHGDPRDESGPLLTVGVGNQRHPDEARRLVERMWTDAMPKRDAGPRPWAVLLSQPDPPWTRVTIPVDGEPLAFDHTAAGDHWVARSELPGYTITLRGRGHPVETVELRRVLDPAPYLADP